MDTISNYSTYVNTALALSQNVSSLKILCVNTTSGNGEEDHDNFFSVPSVNYKKIIQLTKVLVNSLKTFANLAKFSVYELDGLGRDISRFDYMMNQCPPILKALPYNAGCGYNKSSYKNDLARQLITSTMDPQPNNNIKELEVTANCHIEEGSVNYIMKKFKGLEQMTMTIWEANRKLPKKLGLDLFQYFSRVSKYATREYVKKGMKAVSLTWSQISWIVF